MWPDQRYAPARGSFERPVPVPTSEPDATPTRTVSVSCQWLPYVRGALQQLLLQATWQTDDPGTLLLTQQRVFNLIDLFSECEGGPGLACPFDFTAGAASDGGFVPVTQAGITPDTTGAFESGIGWVSTDATAIGDGSTFNDVSIVKTFAVPIVIDDIFIEYNVSRGLITVDSPVNRLIVHDTSLGNQIDSVASSSEGTGIHSRHLHGGPWTIDSIRMDVCAGWDSGDPGGSAVIQFMQFHVVEGSCGGE